MCVYVYECVCVSVCVTQLPLIVNQAKHTLSTSNPKAITSNIVAIIAFKMRNLPFPYFDLHFRRILLSSEEQTSLGKKIETQVIESFIRGKAQNMTL